MKLTDSVDGVPRATIRITFRLGLPEIAEAVTGWAIAQPAAADPFDLQLRTMSKARIEEIVRDRLKAEGPPDQWREEADDDYYRDLREVAEVRVAEVFG